MRKVGFRRAIRLCALSTSAAVMLAGQSQARAQTATRGYAANRERVQAALGKVCLDSGGRITSQDAYHLACETQFTGGRAALMMLANPDSSVPMMSTEYNLIGQGENTTVQVTEIIVRKGPRGDEQRNVQQTKTAAADMEVRLTYLAQLLDASTP